MFANGFRKDTSGLEWQLRHCQQNSVRGLWEAQRTNQLWAVAQPLRNYPLYQFFINLGNLI